MTIGALCNSCGFCPAHCECELSRAQIAAGVLVVTCRAHDYDRGWCRHFGECALIIRECDACGPASKRTYRTEPTRDLGHVFLVEANYGQEGSQVVAIFSNVVHAVDFVASADERVFGATGSVRIREWTQGLDSAPVGEDREYHVGEDREYHPGTRIL